MINYQSTRNRLVQVADACGHTHCYIGLQRADDASPFEWTDGSALSYAAWDAEQPQTGFDETKVLFFSILIMAHVSSSIFLG